MRSFLPAIVILVLLGLVILLPKRGDRGEDVPYLLPGSASVGKDVAAALLSLPTPELDEPPTWALQRGDDDVQRLLDRLAWGGHQALVTTREELLAHRGRLAPEVLSRLTALGATDPVQTAKLIAVLGEEDGRDPAVAEALNRLAFSESSLVSKAALRALAYLPGEAALQALLDRRSDPDLELRSLARAALGHRARAGDQEALGYVIQDLSQTASDPDLIYITVLGETEIPPEGYEVLRRIVEEAGNEASLTATSSLLAHGEPDAIERADAMIADDDIVTRLNGLRMAQLAGAVAGVDSWDQIAHRHGYQEVTSLLSILDRAIRTGSDEAPHAVRLIEELAANPARGAQPEALTLLLTQGHPWALERTRLELQQGVGVFLASTIDRLMRVPRESIVSLADTARERLLGSPDLAEAEQMALMRVMARLDPEGSAELLVERALEPTPFGVTVASLLGPIGAPALTRLAAAVDDDRGAAIYILAASGARDPISLPVLAQIALDLDRDPVVRRYALDVIPQVRGGPRIETIRAVAQQVDDAALRQRARLLFWNAL